jgi:hypothetical protein
MGLSTVIDIKKPTATEFVHQYHWQCVVSQSLSSTTELCAGKGMKASKVESKAIPK